jgi:hypothetical protein
MMTALAGTRFQSGRQSVMVFMDLRCGKGRMVAANLSLVYSAVSRASIKSPKANRDRWLTSSLP